MTRKPSRRASPTAILTKAFQAELGGRSLEKAAASFIAQACEDVDPADLPEVSLQELAAALADFWTASSNRKGRRPSIRLAPMAGDYALERLEIVQDDAPFLVDSIMGEIAQQGFQVRAMFHPVVGVARDRRGQRQAEGSNRRESMIQVILERVGVDREASLLDGIEAALADARAAVADFPAMLELMARSIAELEACGPAGIAPEVLAEDLAFLRWIHAEHFVFLGARTYEYPRLPDGDYAAEEPLYQAKDGLGVLTDPERTVLRRASEPAVLLTQAVRKRLTREPAVTVAKSNVRSRVHRRGYMDYIGVKRYDAQGRPSGEVRFVGLFTAEAYDKPTDEVPLVRVKVARVLARAGKAPGSHNENRLKNILETHPRDELFQMSEDELLAQALAILHLYDRPRVRLLERRDPYDRFASVLLYVPRDHYDSELQATAGRILAQAYGGRASAAYPSFSDAPLARVHFIIGFTPGSHADPDLTAVEAEIAAATRTWEDRFAEAVRARGDADPGVLIGRYARAFPAGYRDRFDAAEALADIAVIETITDAVQVRAFRRRGDAATQFRFKLYRPGGPAPLADVLPILENMGLKAMVEAGFPVTPEGSPPVWVHDFELEDLHGEQLMFDEVKAAFEDAFEAVWTGKTESDGFNRLVLELSVSWRDAALVRALARYRQQSGLDPSQPVQEAALSAHPGVARLILDLFRTKFDPAILADLPARRLQAQAVMDEINEALQQVDSLDDDRVLRRLALLVGAITRTNFYQQDDRGAPKPYISFKLASGELADLPAPKPYREIFVWATHVEGVHLRFGPVARGGLRWSDRRDDFRTEVLALAKAQNTKNAVIVPVGSKGGFYPKHLPKGGTAEAVRAEAIAAYKTFLCGLLDLTDNLTADGAVVHPDGVIVHEGDDPYLVVAADKGTATFSDIANGVARDYGFWLDDAFASGGSAGYDHKVMGITARGAWEAVKRHFRELGKDIQTEPFTVVGVGDMSGDVFGNGMLLSKATRLLAAFDHRHIFLDPDPDPAVSYAERARMFALPRSSWDDYDRKAISKGGGVWSRALKTIPLSPEARGLLDLDADSVSPAELIGAILKARAELLYLGGIGTYVKARSESHLDVGDKTNDAVRIDADALRVRVVGEGANLGFTQAARIAFALRGGRLETDAIDNSAGVDSSDHEVNIKILTGMLERSGTLTRPRRDRLLKSMVGEVAAHVLAHNYDQTLALSLLETDPAAELDAGARLMSRLEAEGRLDRAVEGLPDAAILADRLAAGRGLTRPELAVLLAYGKLELSDLIVESRAPDEPFFERVLEAYFPKPLRKYDAAMRRHRLRREIIATVVSNDAVNRCGPSFPSRLMASAGCGAGAFVAGYEAAKAVLDLEGLWSAVAAQDGAIPATAQLALFRRLAAALRAQTFWMARRAHRDGLGVEALIARYRPAFEALRKLEADDLAEVERAAMARQGDDLIVAGAPDDLARRIAALGPLSTAAELADLSEALGWPTRNAARLYHQVGAAFAFDRLRQAMTAFVPGDHFERAALRGLAEDLLAQQAVLTRALMGFAATPQAGDSPEVARAAVASWAALHRAATDSALGAVAEIEASPGPWTFAKLTLASSALRDLSREGARKRGSSAGTPAPR